MKTKITNFFDKENPNRYLLTFILKYIFFVGTGAAVGIFFAPVLFKEFISINPQMMAYMNQRIYGIVGFEVLFFLLGYHFAYKDLKKYKLLLKEKDIKNDNVIDYKPILDLSNYSFFKKGLIYLGITILFIGLSSLLSNISSSLVGVKEQGTALYFFAMGLIPSLILASTLAVIEELIMRKALQEFLERLFSKLKTFKLNLIIPILLTAMTFALLHNQGNYNYLIFGLGIVLSVIYVVFRNIKLNIFIHVINNIIGVSLIFVTFSSNSAYQLPEFKSETLENSFGLMEKIYYVEENKKAGTLNSKLSEKENIIKESVGIKLNIKYNIFYNKEINKLLTKQDPLTSNEKTFLESEFKRYDKLISEIDKEDLFKDKIGEDLYKDFTSSLNQVRNNFKNNNL